VAEPEHPDPIVDVLALAVLLEAPEEVVEFSRLSFRDWFILPTRFFSSCP
jgi:hypothetical protein